MRWRASPIRRFAEASAWDLTSSCSTGGLEPANRGKSTVDLNEVTAAGRIGSDFLAFPISNLGTGLAVTGGVAVARPIGSWNLGLGGSLRRSTEYQPFNQPGTTLKFTPGDEYRARVGLDHTVGNGRISFGLTYSAFGDDVAGTSVYNTGNRLIAQGVLTNNLMGNDLTVAAYNVFRASGNYANGDPAGRENITNVYVGMGMRLLGTVVEPSLEGRQWLQNVPTASSARRRSLDPRAVELSGHVRASDAHWAWQHRGISERRLHAGHSRRGDADELVRTGRHERVSRAGGGSRRSIKTRGVL